MLPSKSAFFHSAVRLREVASCGVPLRHARARAGVEMFKKNLTEGQAGENVGLLLRGVKREELLRGQVRAPLLPLRIL